MKKAGKWFLSVLTRVLVIILVILLLPFARDLFSGLLPDVSGEISTQSAVLKQQLASSQRLEVTDVEEEGLLEAKTSVVLLGTVGSTIIRYRYTASIGIDLSQVVLVPEENRIVFYLPDPGVLNDGIEALEVKKNDLFSRAVDKSVETLLNEQRLKCRETYLTEEDHAERIWHDTVSAFEETICSWLESYGQRHYQFEYIRQTQNTVG